jgi:hypothetical protein
MAQSISNQQVMAHTQNFYPGSPYDGFADTKRTDGIAVVPTSNFVIVGTTMTATAAMLKMHFGYNNKHIKIGIKNQKSNNVAEYGNSHNF